MNLLPLQSENALFRNIENENATITLNEETEISLLSQYINNQFSKDASLQDVGIMRKSITYASCSAGVVCAYVSGYPIIMGIFKLNINYFFKVVFAGASWISYGGLYSWGTVAIISDQFKHRTPIEAELLQNSSHCCLTTAYKIKIALLGLGACLPNAYFAYILNSNNKLMWMGFNIVGSWGINTYPIHLMFLDAFLPRLEICRPLCHDYYMKNKWLHVKNYLVKLLDGFIEKIPDMESLDIESILDQSLSSEAGNTVDCATKFFENICKIKDQYSTGSVINSRLVQYPVKLIAAILPISSIYSNAKATVELINLWTPSWIAKAIIVPMALSPSYLTYSMTRDFLLYSVENIANKYLGKKVQTTGNRYFPITNKVFLGTAIVISLLSASVDYTAVREIYSEDNALHWVAIIASVTSSLALTLLPMMELSEIMLNLYARCFRNPGINLKLDTSHKIEQLQFYLKRCSDAEIKRFVIHLCKNEMLKKELLEAFPWILGEMQLLNEVKSSSSSCDDLRDPIHTQLISMLPSVHGGWPQLGVYHPL